MAFALPVPTSPRTQWLQGFYEFVYQAFVNGEANAHATQLPTDL
jgi:hypothetical protein